MSTFVLCFLVQVAATLAGLQKMPAEPPQLDFQSAIDPQLLQQGSAAIRHESYSSSSSSDNNVQPTAHNSQLSQFIHRLIADGNRAKQQLQMNNGSLANPLWRFSANPHGNQPTLVIMDGATLLSPSLTCGSFKYMLKASDHKFYSCCEDKVYNWSTEECFKANVTLLGTGSNNGTTGHQRGETRRQEHARVCNGVKYFVAAEFADQYGCCGSKLYDKTISQCEEDADVRSNNVKKVSMLQPELVNSPQKQQSFSNSAETHFADVATTAAPTRRRIVGRPTTTTTKPRFNCPEDFICCPGYMPVSNENQRLKCCFDSGPYDPALSQCLAE